MKNLYRKLRRNFLTLLKVKREKALEEELSTKWIMKRKKVTRARWGKHGQTRKMRETSLHQQSSTGFWYQCKLHKMNCCGVWLAEQKMPKNNKTLDVLVQNLHLFRFQASPIAEDSAEEGNWSTHGHGRGFLKPELPTLYCDILRLNSAWGFKRRKKQNKTKTKKHTLESVTWCLLLCCWNLTLFHLSPGPNPGDHMDQQLLYLSINC